MSSITVVDDSVDSKMYCNEGVGRPQRLELVFWASIAFIHLLGLTAIYLTAWLETWNWGKKGERDMGKWLNCLRQGYELGLNLRSSNLLIFGVILLWTVAYNSRGLGECTGSGLWKSLCRRGSMIREVIQVLIDVVYFLTGLHAVYRD